MQLYVKYMSLYLQSMLVETYIISTSYMIIKSTYYVHFIKYIFSVFDSAGSSASSFAYYIVSNNPYLSYSGLSAAPQFIICL